MLVSHTLRFPCVLPVLSMSEPITDHKTAQQRFNERYITAPEVCEFMGVGRATLMHARRRGTLPDAVEINGGQVFVWEREKLRPYLEAWKLMLDVRRGVPA